MQWQPGTLIVKAAASFLGAEPAGFAAPLPRKFYQFRIHFIRVRPSDRVRAVLDNEQARPLDQTHAKLAVGDAPAATFQLAWTACSLMRLPRKTSVL